MEGSLGLRAKPRGKPGRKKRTSVLCQVHGCGEELLGAKHYYLRYRICRQHSVEPCLLIGGKQQRFCQQCGRFHLLSAFQGNQRSCRDKLKRHKARRRGSRGGHCGQRARRKEPGSSDWEDGDESSRYEGDSADDSAAEEAEGEVREGPEEEEEDAASYTSVAVAAAKSGSSSQGAAESGGHAQQAAAGDGAPDGRPASRSASPSVEAREAAGGGSAPPPGTQRGKAAVKEEQLGGDLERHQPMRHLSDKRFGAAAAAACGYTTSVPQASEPAGLLAQAEGIMGSDAQAIHDLVPCKEEDCHMDADELLLVLPALPGPCWGEPLLLLGGGCHVSGYCLEKQGSNDVAYESFPPPAGPAADAEPLPEDLPFDVPDFLLAEAEVPPLPTFYAAHTFSESAMAYPAGAAAPHGHSPSYHAASYQHTSCCVSSPCHVSSPTGGFPDQQLVPLAVGDMGSGVFGAGGHQQGSHSHSTQRQLSGGFHHAAPAVACCTGGAQPEHVVAHVGQLAPAGHASHSAQHAQQKPGSVFAATMPGAGSSVATTTNNYMLNGRGQQPWIEYLAASAPPGLIPHAGSRQLQLAAHAAPAAPTASAAPTSPLSSVFQPILSVGQGPSPFFPPAPKKQQLDAPAASTSAGVVTTAMGNAAKGWQQGPTSLFPAAAAAAAAATASHSPQGASGYATRRCDSAAVLCYEESPPAGHHSSVFLASQGGRQAGVLKGRIIRADSALLMAAV